MKNLRIEQFVKGTLVEFGNGEIWQVVGNEYVEEVLMKPYNEIALYEGIEAYIFGLRYIETNAVTILF